MKFAKRFFEHQVLLWAPFYLNYDALRSLIKFLRIEALDGDLDLESTFPTSFVASV